ncbi:MAG: voltage-gated potassium channel [Myxococcales bacterium]|nr:voltage-gated potassium channel [Myxococcales bacterium]|tara:strand:+ start:270 stop:1043 length:774 start_codon:yes stop_codon:yes gene_type:complete
MSKVGRKSVRAKLEKSIEDGILGRLSLLMIIAYMVCFTLETVPDFAEYIDVIRIIENTFTIIFTAEYVLRITVSKKPIRYCLSFFGLVDFLSTIPAMLVLVGVPNPFGGATVLRILRVLRIFKIFRSKKMNSALQEIGRALADIKNDLVVFGVGVLLMLYLSAVGIYYFEHDAQPESFSSIPAAMWWAVATLTTVGYGDAYPITTGGKVFTGCITLVGVGLVAIPTSLITAAITKQREKRNIRKREKQRDQAQRLED